uniref:Uncharacterized protein n=1 Tax=Romanomermis culicivorax TaxID=13658 RepID=A0A915IUA5_ROMCU
MTSWAAKKEEQGSKQVALLAIQKQATTLFVPQLLSPCSLNIVATIECSRFFLMMAGFPSLESAYLTIDANLTGVFMHKILATWTKKNFLSQSGTLWP